MTAIPINKALINFEDVMLKEGLVNLIHSFNHRNILKNLHLDVLKNQNLMVKIQKFYENGSIKDVLYKSVIKLLLFNIIGSINLFNYVFKLI